MASSGLTRIERFWSKVNKHGRYPKLDAIIAWPSIKGTRCYEWTAGKARRGYGVFDTVGEGQAKAHRFAYLLYHGEHSLDGGKWIKDKIYPWIVCHKCDNTSCVREEHLFKGTHLDNVKDRDKKKRQSRLGNKGSVYGEAHSGAVLTDKKVLKARKLYATGNYAIKALAKTFGVSVEPMRLAIIGRTWKHLNREEK